MKLPEGYVVIYQPKYTVPSVFDLNDCGFFSERPKVSGEWGFRIICDKDCRCKVQAAMLLRQPGKDPDTGRSYEWWVKEAEIALDESLVLDPEAVAQQLSDEEMRSAFITEFNAWHDNLVPLKDDAKVDTDELKKKLAALVADAFDRRRKDLVRRNQHWVLSNIPRRS
ncbi:hypothetical protein [Desulfosarcina cetonica]|uniref:hypothetical protein n=1 Tax=Desulfosarcina cetonica TaxID=90730 RepID=UPI0006D1A74D|nr:hypothetical protein [Desulfosarcina cetonica]